MIQDIELRIMPSGNIAVFREYGFIPTEQLTEEEKEFIVECVHKELGWTRPAFEVDGSIGSPDYERGFKHGRDFQAELSAKSTDTDKVIAYLVHQKGYPISTNGEIPSYEETFESVKSIIENTLSEDPDKSLEEAAKEYEWSNVDTNQLNPPTLDMTVQVGDLRNAFKAGAEWGAEHLRDSTKMIGKSLEGAANEFANQDCVTFISRKKGFIAGAEWQKEQMLKDAIPFYEILKAVPSFERENTRIIIVNEEE